MKTQSTEKLSFKRQSVIELSADALATIHGGGESIADFMPLSTCLCPIIIKATRQF
ncbi:hypothetical protein [Flavobacterium sp. CAU 1735]|uniref:hypothetical protein n=1 Tax=Flavobacterium sp. CAU 1735 TaxID=3140361 RepID=UPI0032607C3D